MAIFIGISTTLNEVNILDYNVVTDEIYLDYHGKIGQPLSFSRGLILSLTDPDCSIVFNTSQGSTKFFKIADVVDVEIDGVSIGASTIEDILNGIGGYLFTPVGGTPVPSSSTVDFSFGVGKQNVIFQRVSMTGTVTALTLTNIATYKIFLNDVDVTSVLPFTFNNGDRFWVECTRTNTALAGSILMTTDGIVNPITYSSTTYYKPRTTHYIENMAITQNYVDGIGVRGTGSTLSYLTNCIFTNPVKGVFEIQMPPINSIGSFTNFRYGLNNLTVSNTVANRFPRCQYMILIRNNFFEILELGVSKANVLIGYTELHWSKITSTLTSPGVYTIRYYYSDNNRATWTLLYTSLATHDGTVNFHSDFVANYGYYLQTHLAELTQS
jgi:hypothetical protein